MLLNWRYQLKYKIIFRWLIDKSYRAGEMQVFFAPADFYANDLGSWLVRLTSGGKIGIRFNPLLFRQRRL